MRLNLKKRRINLFNLLLYPFFFSFLTVLLYISRSFMGYILSGLLVSI